MKFDILYNFISPRTGRILSNLDYVLVGDKRGVATPSPILIDIRLDLINLRRDHSHLVDDLSNTRFVLNTPNENLPNAQDLISLAPGGILKSNASGIIAIAIAGTDYATQEQINFLQDQITTLDGIVAGHTTTLAAHSLAIAGISATLYTPITGLVSVVAANTIAIGALTVTVTAQGIDIGNLRNVKYIVQTANSIVPNAQPLDVLNNGIMIKGNDGVVSTIPNTFASNNNSYIIRFTSDLINLPNAQAIDNLPSPLPLPSPFNNIYKLVAVDVGGLSDNKLLIAPPLTDLSVLPLVSYGGVYVTADQGATISLTLYGTAAPPAITPIIPRNLAGQFISLLASLALSDVILGSHAVNFGAGQSIGALFDPILPAGTSRILKAIYHPDLINPRGEIALAVLGVDYLNNTSVLTLIGHVSGSGPLGSPITTTFNLTLNQISNAGNINVNNFKIINLADPTNPQDTVNLRTLETYIDNIPLDITLQGDVTGVGATGTPINTILELTLDQIKVAIDSVDLNNQKIINLKSDEVEQLDALNAKFLWDLMHDEVGIIWQ